MDVDDNMSASSTSTILISLLNSLHAELQSQTLLLPTLHAQLGLPPSALEDDLGALQKQLIQSVEDQVNSRRDEVEKWMEKCNTVEEDCVRFCNALGGHNKATGITVGELRKEQVLPRRYEHVMAYQEKLRKMYNTKVEQLTTFTNRITILANTLGYDYFLADVLQEVKAPREKNNLPHAFLDVTPERFSKIEKELVRGKAEYNKRLSHLAELFLQVDWLYSELGMEEESPRVADLPSTSKSAQNFLTSSISGLHPLNASVSTPHDIFVQSTPTPGSRHGTFTFSMLVDSEPDSEFAYRKVFATFIARADEIEEEGLGASNTVPPGLENVEPTQGLIKWATEQLQSLEEIKVRREKQIQAMYDQLEGLWRRLGIPENKMDEFVDAHRGSTEQTVRDYEEELERMLELKKERMGEFIGSAREEIVKLWDELLIGDDERADFAPFVDDEHTEELLAIHEDEIKRLKADKREKAPILSAVKKYFEVCDLEKELAAAAADQTRLTGRGQRGDPGRLLREEKMRKRVTKEKPRLELELLESIPRWEEDNARQFLIYGESMLQFLNETATVTPQDTKRKTTRGNSVPPRATTPSDSGAPPPRAGTVTPAVRSAPASSQSVPNKRRKVAEPSQPTRTAHTRQASGGSGTRQAANGGRVPLGPHRGNGVTKAGSSPAKPYGRTASGTQLHKTPATAMKGSTGRARAPSGPAASSAYSVKTKSLSGSTSSVMRGRGGAVQAPPSKADIQRKAARARKESFRPRPSLDHLEATNLLAGLGTHPSSKWGLAESVLEEDEC